MQIRTFLLPIVIVLVVVTAILLAFVAWLNLAPAAGYLIFGVIVFLILFSLFVYWFRKNSYILVDEMDAAVIFYKGTNNFAYFIDPLPSEVIAPGRPYNVSKTGWVNALNNKIHQKDPYHFYIDPFKERVQARAPKRPFSVKQTTSGIRTREGIPVTITWNVGYNLDVALIKPGVEYKLARAIPNHHMNMITGKAIHSLRYMIEQRNVADLYTTDAIKKLEIELRHEVTKRIQGLGFKDIAQSDVILGPIEVPVEVEKAIKETHERELQTETTVRALEKIKRAINEYEKNDMDRLEELERLRILDRHANSLFVDVYSKISQ